MGDVQTYEEWRQRWPGVIVDRRTDEAIGLLRRYYSSRADGTPLYTGARFEATAALNDDPHSLGPADFVAVSMLSVDVPAAAAIRLMERDAARITALLKQIPTDRDIVDVDAQDLSSQSPAGELWNLLRNGGDRLGRTKTSKLMAAKRPRLIPIWDSLVEQATGLSMLDYWRRIQFVLTDEGRAVWDWLTRLRSETGGLPADVSNLRILDVLLWMSIEAAK